jgi:hemerythrin
MTQTPAAAAVSAIDNEHQVQVALLDTLTENLAAAADPTELEGIMSQVSDYTSVHFMSEQLLMRLHGYPGYERIGGRPR